MAIGIAGKSGASSDPVVLSTHTTRLAFVLVLASFQFIAISWLFDFGDGTPRWSNPVFLLRQAILTGIVALACFILIVWQQRGEIIALWQASDEPRHLRVALAVNLALFAALVLATILLARVGARAGANQPWHWFWAYTPLLAATGLSLARHYAPLQFWLGLLRAHPIAMALALAAAVVVQLASLEAQQGWNGLAAAALAVSFEILAPLDQTAYVDYATQRIGAQGFWVIIDASCSGYEGIALVTMFLAIYLVVFRHALRFPAALALIPLGIAAVWLLNAVRIAGLVLIGAYVSPEVALKGFHSQAGWLSFLAVTIAIMVLAHRAPAFNREATSVAPASSTDRQALALLAPFMALMAGHILIAAAAPHGEWFIAAKLAGVAAALWLFRDVYRQLVLKLCPVALLAGILVGAAWIMTDPASTERAAKLAGFLAAQTPALATLWLIMRASVGIVLVPIAEELAFRGFLYAFLARRGPVTLAPAGLSLLAITVTSLLFGILHERWLAGALAGAVFALIMVRRGRLADAIAAHVAANAVVIGWALATRQWSLL